MDLLVIGLLIFCTASSTLWIGHGQSTFNLLSYGAKGDGLTDDSHAFMNAWSDACAATESTSTLVVPESYSFQIQPTNFKGPCKPNKINIQVLGTIVAPKEGAWNENPTKHSWILFSNVDGLNIIGSGVIDGQGSEWWTRKFTPRKALYGKSGSKQHPGPTVNNPTPLFRSLLMSLRFESCNDLHVSGIKLINSPGRHIDLYGTSDVILSNLNITSPGDSPNTDGIDVSHSSHVTISNSFIGVGDDCIAIKGGSSYLNISQIACGPGHGISIGSLRGDDTVEEVHVWDCSFNGSTNGARIKTWPGGKGYARKISFKHMRFDNTRYPIIIDQQYSDNLQSDEAGIKVSDVTYFDFEGTCAEEKAISLTCGSIGCSNVSLAKVNITSSNPKTEAAVVCKNAQGRSSDTVPFVHCLSEGGSSNQI